MSEKLTIMNKIMRDILFKKPKTEEEKDLQLKALIYVTKINKSRKYITCDNCCYDIVDDNGEIMEHECLITCCGVYITSLIEENGRCPKCLENI
jgi:hypothetical protein